METTVHRSTWAGIPPGLAYRILALRVSIFVVEQNCPYQELDGADLGEAAEHRWIESADEPGRVLSYLRVLPLVPKGAARRIGRVVTDPTARGRGLAGRLIRSVLADHPGPFVLAAQSHLTSWYGSFGFVAAGPEFVEDGILHTPMRRDGGVL